MALILSGTDGLSDVDGTAATPAIRGTDANTGMFFPAADTIAFAEGGVEAARLDAAGNMGLGVTPSAWGSDTRALQIFNRTSLSDLQSTTQLTNNGHWNGANWVYRETATAGNYFINGNTHVWRYAASGTAGATLTWSEAMRIDSSGNLLVGTTSAGPYGANIVQRLSGGTVWSLGPITGQTARWYLVNAAGTGVYLADGANAWTANSDERIKEIIEPISDAANKVSTLRAVIGKYKTDVEGTRRSFLIAQDVQAVLPEAVNASNPEELGVQYTDTIPLLVAAIKEQQVMIEQLKADVAALKGTV